jgi:hypothetical protein
MEKLDDQSFRLLRHLIHRQYRLKHILSFLCRLIRHQQLPTHEQY